MKVAFYKGTHSGIKGLFNKLVRWWTSGKYSHVEAVLEEYSDGNCLCASSSWIDGGVRLKIINFNNDNKWDVIDVPVFDTDKAKQWFQTNEDMKYDLLGLLGFVFKRGLDDKTKSFCSESVLLSQDIPEANRFDPNSMYVLCQTLNTKVVEATPIEDRIKRLYEIDVEAIRPQREILIALLNGHPTPDYAIKKLASLEKEAAELRSKFTILQ
jgi:hypothetical protein